MKVNQRYGHTRPAAIAAQVAAARAAVLPVETEVAPVETETRLPYIESHPGFTDREEHRAAQCRMFAAAHVAGLAHNAKARIAGINALLGTSFETSRVLTPAELLDVAFAIETGAFDCHWNLIEAEPTRPLTDEDAPPEVEEVPDFGNPAPLERIEAIAQEFAAASRRAQLRHWIAEWQVERAEIRGFLSHLQTYRQTPEVVAEIERLSARLQDLDDYLIFEPDGEIEPEEFDEHAADLPDDLDGSYPGSAQDELPFRLGFDDLPAAYFTHQGAAQLAA